MVWLTCDGVLPERWSLIYAQCSAPHSFASARADMGIPCTSLLGATTRPVRWALLQVQHAGDVFAAMACAQQGLPLKDAWVLVVARGVTNAAAYWQASFW